MKTVEHMFVCRVVVVVVVGERNTPTHAQTRTHVATWDLA